MRLAEKLINIQSATKAPKNLYNNFGNYSYRNAEGILEAVKPHLLANRCSLTVEDTLTEIGGSVYITATATLRDCDSDETIKVSAFAKEPESKKGMDASQVTGATSSYARKYALNGLFLLDDTKDADSDEYTNEANNRAARTASKPESKPATKPTQASKPATKKGDDVPVPETAEEQKAAADEKVNANHLAAIKAQQERTGITTATLLKFYGIKSLEELTIAQFTDCMNNFKVTKAR